MIVNPKSWELIYERLHKEGWNLGWVSTINKLSEMKWVVSGSRGKLRLFKSGKDIVEAFLRFHESVCSIGN